MLTTLFLLTCLFCGFFKKNQFLKLEGRGFKDNKKVLSQQWTNQSSCQTSSSWAPDFSLGAKLCLTQTLLPKSNILENDRVHNH